MKNHHLFHAYAASLSIDTPESLIVIMDGRGCRPQDNGEKYKSSRNILSGIIGSLSIEKFINNITLDFIEYDNQNITVYTN